MAKRINTDAPLEAAEGEYQILDFFPLNGKPVARGLIVRGVLKKGMIASSTWRTPIKKPLEISGIEFADNVSTREYWVCLLFKDPPSIEVMRQVLQRGIVLTFLEEIEERKYEPVSN